MALLVASPFAFAAKKKASEDSLSQPVTEEVAAKTDSSSDSDATPSSKGKKKSTSDKRASSREASKTKSPTKTPAKDKSEKTTSAALAVTTSSEHKTTAAATKAIPTPSTTPAAATTSRTPSHVTTAPIHAATSATLKNATKESSSPATQAQASDSTKTLLRFSHQFDEATNALRDGLLEKNNNAVSAGIAQVRKLAVELRSEAPKLPLNLQFRVKLVARMYEEGAEIVEKGQSANEIAQVQVGLERIDQANATLQKMAGEK